MTEDQLLLKRAAARLVDSFRAAGLSWASRLAFELTYAAWKLAGSSQGQDQWRWLVDRSMGDAADVLSSGILELGEGRDRLAALSGRSIHSALVLIDDVLARYGRDGLRNLADALLAAEADSYDGMEVHSTPRWVADLMADLVGPAVSAFDPAAGTGTGLLALAERGAHVCGVDLNGDAASVALRRLEMAGVPGRVEWGDSLQGAAGPDRSWEAVVAAPPFAMALSEEQRQGLERAGVPQVLLRGRRDLYWVYLAAQLLQPGGRAAVLLHEGSSSASAGLEYLWGEGMLEGVVFLPANCLPHTAIPAALWLVRRPGEATGEFFVADASIVTVTDGPRRRNILTPERSRVLVDLVRQFRQGARIDAPGHLAKAVSRDEIDLGRGLRPAVFLDEAPAQVEVPPEPAGHLLTGLVIEGYKSLRDSTQLPLAPLTVVYGPNSSGKSSLIQSLLLLKQSLDAPHLVTQGPVVDVGSFVGVRHRHEAPQVRFAVEFGAPVWDLPTEGTPDPTCSRRLEFTFQDGGDGRGSLQSCSIDAGSLHTTWQRAGAASMSVPTSDLVEVFGELGTGTFLFPFDTRQPSPGDDENTIRARSERNRRRAQGYAKKLERNGINELTIDWAGLVPSGSSPRLPRHTATEREGSVVQSYADRTARLVAGPGHELRTMLAGLTYLGPLRSAPQRFYNRTSSTGTPGDGRESVLYLYDHANAVQQVNDSFQQLEIPYELAIVPLSAGDTAGLVGDLIAVSLKDLRSGVTVTPADVGYGISQCMPLVVELSARSKSVICIEQPETHLHPRLQARLADLLIDSTRAEDRANQVIVETHSEHLMLRLQRRIREGDLDPQDLCVLYVDQDEEGAARVQRLRVDDEGDFIDEWPDGFFDERMDELFGGME